MVINVVKKGQGEECVNFLSKELCYGVVNAEERKWMLSCAFDSVANYCVLWGKKELNLIDNSEW